MSPALAWFLIVIYGLGALNAIVGQKKPPTPLGPRGRVIKGMIAIGMIIWVGAESGVIW